MRNVAVAVCVVLVLGGCSGTPAAAPSASPSAVAPSAEEEPAVKVGQRFRNGEFDMTITKVELGVKQIDLDPTANAGGLKPFTPENGQFVMVHATATNVGQGPAAVSSTDSVLTDQAGKEYAGGGLYLGGVVGQGFEENQQPGTTRQGWFAFDVPASVTAVATVVVLSDPTAPPTVVQIG